MTIRILAASDLSDAAGLAVERAAMLAGRCGGQLLVVHVVGDDDALPETTEAARLLREQVERIGATAAAHLDVVRGKPFVAIIRHARSVEADLLVLGAHGAHGVSDLLMGTTAERVIRKGDRPVLVVKRRPDREYRRVLVAMDLSEPSLAAFVYARSLLAGCEFEIAHVFTLVGERATRGSNEHRDALHRRLAREARDGIESMLVDAGIASRDVRVVVQGGSPTAILPKLAARPGVDLVVVGTHGMGASRQVLLGSVAQHVLRDAPCDVLVVRRGPPVFELP